MKLLVSAGANPEARLSWNGSQIPAVTVIDETFGRKFPEEALEVKQLIRQKLEAKVGRRRANEIEKHWEQTPQELRRQAERLDQMEKEKRVRDAQLKEEQAEELAVLYGKKIRPTAKEDDIFSGIDQEPVMIIKFPWEETESLPQTPEEKPAVLIIPKKKRWSSNLRKFVFWRSRLQR
jgi:hypothetical protein